MTAALKLHLAINLVSGAVKWFQFTEGSTHDSRCFPGLMAGALYIFDLGYWSAQRFIDIGNEKAFFLSRIKTILKLTVTKAVMSLIRTLKQEKRR